jgi:superoxide reductase
MSISGNIRTADFKSEKHVPVIEASTKCSEGYMTVTVSVGKEIAHPNTLEHYIEWIALFFKGKEGNIIDLGKAVFSAHGNTDKSGTFTAPSITLEVKLSGKGTLTAVSYCNLHGLWENSIEV